ncbi:hypothetical protein [Microbacterium terricola]|uniref:Leucyl-tRNA synthetase n=1 Tax=Microbacterium terricola TaxID=344163 RepID=A0ABM8E098_9MICO|nr:hypothetical protein [Microbacterium terricola]UYK40897.1 hypothetical protein OAU46_04415 [Microbacterium terricola]BDV31353.1 hypothetical protein Microterr_20130 [Microbacterium terricola]
MSAAVDAIVEIFTWVGLGAGALLALSGVIMLIADGSWAPVHVLIDDGPEGRVARWIDHAGGVNESALTAEQDAALAHRDQADAYARVGVPGRLRLTKGAPGVRFVLRLAAGFAAIGALAFILSLVLLFAEG